MRGEWLTLQPGAHDGYIDWERAEAIRRMVSENVPTSRHHGAPKHGDALLAGLVRCRRCGRKLTVRYSGVKHNIPRYACHRGLLDDGEPRCIAFGGLRVDDAIEAALLEVVEPGAIAAAAEAEAEAAGRHDQARQAMLRDLEAARYEADRAFRQYDAADPENRLVAAELEARWNRALARFGEAEAKLAAHDGAAPARTEPRLPSFATLAHDSRPSGKRRQPMPGSRRIVHTVIREVIADVDIEAGAIVLLTTGWAAFTPSRCRDVDAASAQHLVRHRCRRPAPRADRQRRSHRRTAEPNKLTTGHGNRWTRERVTSLRSHHKIPVHRPADDAIEPWLNLTKAAAHLGVSPKTLRLAAEGAEIKALYPLRTVPIFAQATLTA